MQPTVTVICSVCGGEAFETICTALEIEAQHAYLCRFHRRRLRPDAPRLALEERAEFTQDYATNIDACPDCGLLLRNPRPSREQIRKAYQQDDYGPERLAALFPSQLELYRPKARRLARRLPRGARVVEVGSFVGGFLAAGQECGWEVLGFDPGEEVDAFCAARHLPVFRGALPDAPVPAGSVDCVAIWNTFDQLPDPAPTLAAAQRLLKPGGLLALRVPNGACFRAYLTGYRRCRHTGLRFVRGGLLRALAWNNLLTFPYLYGYSAPTLDRLLMRYGLAREAVQGDTLVRLADAQTRRWAAWEERLVKLSCRLALSLEGALRPRNPYTLAPWLDAYYRKSRDQGSLPRNG